MLLAIDVGNTTVSVGIFGKSKLVLTKRIITEKQFMSGRYYLAEFKKILYDKHITKVIISSVVPDTTKVIEAVFKKGLNIAPTILGRDLIVPIKNLYKNPKQVGQDRLVNAYAGYKKFGGGLIIVDFGTAVTFDVVSKKGEYLGGIIVPGIEIALTALSEKAALLPKIKIDSRFPPSGTSRGNDMVLIGKDTVSSMRSGVIYGYTSLCDGMIAKIKLKTQNSKLKTIFTGGHARLIAKYCHFDYLEPNLTLEGLNLLASA